MRATFFASLVVAATLFGAPATADHKPVVLVELFTSQGCSSCPPADALIAELAGRDDVLPLALHVDYWDYIGWADSFARPEHTARQKAYAHAAGERSIYTPQIVVGGTDHVVGFKPMKLADYIQAHRALMGEVELDAEVSADGVLTLTAAPHGGARLPGGLRVDLVGFEDRATVAIEHGENAGETITYANIVTSWDRVGQWDGTGAFSATAKLPGDGPCAVIVQEAGPGRVLAALRVR